MSQIKVNSFEDDVRQNLHKYVGEVGQGYIPYLSMEDIVVEKYVQVDKVEYYLCATEFLDNAFDNSNKYVEIKNVTNDYIKISNDTTNLSLTNSYIVRGVSTLSDTLELITQNQFSSSNFDKKDYKKGMFGIGLKIAFLTLPDICIVLCDANGEANMILSGQKKSSKYDNRFGNLNTNTFNVFIKNFVSLMEYFKYKSIIYGMDLIYLNRSIRVVIDNIPIVCTKDTLRDISVIKLGNSNLSRFECLTNESDIITVYAGESNKESLLFVNGKEVKESSLWVNKMREILSSRLSCTNANIKSKISMCCQVNIRDAKFSANVKNSLENIKSVTLHGDLDLQFFRDIVKTVIDRSKDNKIKKVELSGFSRARDSKNLTLYIVEGLSAESSFRNSVNRKNSAIFCTQGKVLNCIKNRTQAESNETVLQIARILGLNFHMDEYKGSYNKIVIACDPDPDGFHIVGLILNMFNTLWPFMLTRFEILAFPLYSTLAGYSYVITDNVKKYYKGLGSFTVVEMKNLMKDSSYLKTLDVGDKINFIDAFFNVNSKFRFDMLQSTPRPLESYLPNKTLTIQDIISMLHLYSEDVCDRSIPDLSGFTRAERQAIYGSLNQSDKLLSVVGTIISKSAYQHAPDNMVGVVMKLGRTYVGSNNITILNIVGSNGSRLKAKDYSSARYLRMGKSKINMFPSGLHNSCGYHTDEGKTTIPKMLTLYPFLFINGNYGIGCGIKTYIPCHNPEQVIDYVTDKTSSIPSIWYRGFIGTIETNDENNTFVSVGTYKVDSYAKHILKFTVTEIPIGIFVDKFISRIPTKLTSKTNTIDTVEEANEQDNIRSDDIDVVDFSTYDNIEIVVTVNKCGNVDQMIQRIEHMMKLTHHMSLRIYHDKQLHLFNNRTEMFKYYKRSILEYSSKYLSWIIAKITNEINIINMKIRIIEELISVNINTISDVDEYLTTRVDSYDFKIYNNMKASHISNKHLLVLRNDELIKQTKILDQYKKYTPQSFYTYHLTLSLGNEN
jgi:hypothetical protein